MALGGLGRTLLLKRLVKELSAEMWPCSYKWGMVTSAEPDLKRAIAFRKKRARRRPKHQEAK